MISRNHTNRLSLLLAGTALVTMAALPQSSFANSLKESGTLVIAQAAPAEAPPADKKPAEKKPEAAKPQPQQKPQERTSQQPQPPRQEQRPQERATQQQQQQPPQEQRRQERTQERGNERRPGQAPAAQQQQPSPSTAQQPQTTPPPAAQDRRDQRRMGQQPQAPAAQQQQPSTAQQPQTTTPPTAQDRREQRRMGQQPQAPATQQQQPSSPSTAQQPQTTTPPTAQDRREQRRMGQQPQAPATQQPLQAPTAQQPSQQAPVAAQSNPAAIAAPTQPRDAREFMRRDGQGPGRRIDEVRKDRQETRDGNRVVIREGDRTIIREGDRTIINHNESNRFTINASNVRSERRGANTETIVQRGGGYSIVTVTDDNGRMLRRLRRDQRGRDVVIIDNSFGPRAANMYIQLAPPVIRIPRERYIVEMGRSRPEDVYGVFIAPPVEALAERYTLDQVRYSAPLRDRMPRVDLDVTFETGSWQLAPEQIDKLSVVAEGISKALARNPREVFMVEGYTDATGADEDNLSLSDRRAESVAVALTEQFKVPPENLVTQGYGEQYLKVDSQGPEEANRRVAVRRITPLIDGPATNATR